MKTACLLTSWSDNYLHTHNMISNANAINGKVCTSRLMSMTPLPPSANIPMYIISLKISTPIISFKYEIHHNESPCVKRKCSPHLAEHVCLLGIHKVDEC